MWAHCNVWPLTASITMEVKNNHGHVTTQRILNKFIDIIFSVGCRVWPWCCLFHNWLPVKILMRIYSCYNSCGIFFPSMRYLFSQFLRAGTLCWAKILQVWGRKTPTYYILIVKGWIAVLHVCLIQLPACSQIKVHSSHVWSQKEFLICLC